MAESVQSFYDLFNSDVDTILSTARFPFFDILGYWRFNSVASDLRCLAFAFRLLVVQRLTLVSTPHFAKTVK